MDLIANVKEIFDKEIFNDFILNNYMNKDSISEMEILLKFFDLYCNMDSLDEELLHKIENKILPCGFNITLEKINILLDHANIFFIRNSKNYLVQIYYVLRVFLKIYSERKFFGLIR